MCLGHFALGYIVIRSPVTLFTPSWIDIGWPVMLFISNVRMLKYIGTWVWLYWNMGDYMEHVVISLPVVLFISISSLRHSFIFATDMGHYSQWLLVMSANAIIFVFVWIFNSHRRNCVFVVLYLCLRMSHCATLAIPLFLCHSHVSKKESQMIPSQQPWSQYECFYYCWGFQCHLILYHFWCKTSNHHFISTKMP